MSKIFSWEYFSFLTLDDGVVYKVEILLREGVGDGGVGGVDEGVCEGVGGVGGGVGESVCEGVGGGDGEDGVECVGGEGCESGNSDGGDSAL